MTEYSEEMFYVKKYREQRLRKIVDDLDLS